MKTFTVLLAAALLCGCNKSAPPTLAAPTKWSYKVVEMENSEHQIESEAFKKSGQDMLDAKNSSRLRSGDFYFLYYKELDAAGVDGWEMVAVIPQTETTHPIGQDGIIASVRTGKIIFIFKRPSQ
jgi:hypothetical protein